MKANDLPRKYAPPAFSIIFTKKFPEYFYTGTSNISKERTGHLLLNKQTKIYFFYSSFPLYS